MSEIEKMCENTRVYDFRYDCDVSFSDGDFGRVTNCSKGEIKDYCTDKKYFKGAKVINVRHLYPPFTAEKKLELIKWLGELDMLEILRTTREDKAWIINSEYGMSGNVYKHTSRMKSFEEAIAGLINSLWQDLTESEQEQIADILRG